MEAYNKEWMETNKTPDEKIEVIRRGSQHPHYIGIFVGTERIETKRFGNIFTSVEERPHQVSLFMTQTAIVTKLRVLL